MKKSQSSKYCLVCRNILFSMAQHIGPNTLEVIRKIYYSGISPYDAHKMDFLIYSDIFTHSKIERASVITLKLSTFTFAVFESVLINL